MNRLNGNIYWKSLLPSDPPFLGGSLNATCAWHNLLFIGSGNSRVYALTVDSGLVKWTFMATQAIHTDCLAEDGIVYVGSLNNDFYALDALTGELRWQYKTLGSIEHGPPSIEGNIVTFSSSDGFLYGLDRNNGRLLFKYANSFNPILRASRLYFGGNNNGGTQYFIKAVQIYK